MKSLKKITYLFVFLLGFGLVSCSDSMDEVTDIDYSRAFSPFELTARVRSQVNVELNWTPIKADHYSVEVFQNDSLTFAGTPVLTVNDVKASDLPYTIHELNGNTQYSFRIKAILSGTGDSKWSGVYVKTQSENIFIAFEDTDIQANSITLRWNPTPNATKLTVEILDGAVIEHMLTTSEIAAGSAQISNLTGETEYVAKIFNGDVQRGRTTFTTLLDLGNAIPINPEDDLVAKLAAAKSGDVFALFPGTYGTSSKFVIPTNVEIKAVYPSNKPIMQGYFSMENNSALLIKDVVVDGTGLADNNQAIIFATTGASYGDIVFEGCEIKNHVKGVFYLNVAAVVESIVFNNTLIHNIECNGGDMFDSRTGVYKLLKITNSTLYSSAVARDMIRLDNASANFTTSYSPQVIVENNTFYKVCDGSARRLLYIRYPGNDISFKKNIVANTQGQFSNQSSTNPPAFGGNNYFNAPGFYTPGVDGSGTRFFDDTSTKLDPGFAGAATNNFKVSNQTLIDNNIGDPRWLK